MGEEINVVSEASKDGDALITSILDNAQLVATNDLIMHHWILYLGPSFHVTPHKKWFTNYDASCKG